MSVLANALRFFGFHPVFVLDIESDPLPFELLYPIERICGSYDEVCHAQIIIDTLQRLDAKAIVADSYRISRDWIQLLNESGIVVIIIDDLGIGGDAALRIDYRPRARGVEGSAEALLGPAYFISDCPSLQPRSSPPSRVIAHAGGTGNFAAAEHVYAGALRVVREKGLHLTWLCPNETSKAWVACSGMLQTNDAVIGWQGGRRDFWADYDIVVGPASTSLYESIMQGVLPVSFPISATQTSDREPWLGIGHTLHLTVEEMGDTYVTEALFRLAVTKYDLLRTLLTNYSFDLDGRGTNRVAVAICNLMNGSYSSKHVFTKSKSEIKECDILDSHAFLVARNAQHVRALSTEPEHIISWPEHLNWWLSPVTQKFKANGKDGTEAFFWHRPQTVGGRDYLIGGWFPTTSQLTFTTAIQLLDWQLTYCADLYPRHIWVATINVKNSAVLLLNRRYGFTDPDSQTLAIIRELFPGNNENFVILQRKAELS
jgi:hypothetical protein